jgi:hypothetical protein
MNYYGHETPDEIRHIIGEVCNEFASGSPNKVDLFMRSFALITETLCAESQFGTFPDLTNESGFGIAQMDAGFEDAKKRSMKYQDFIYSRWGVNIDLVQLIELRYNVFLSVLFCRLFYKLIPEPIPGTVEGRAKYWKKYYNTFRGKGTEMHYIKSVEAYKELDKQGNIA